ncbi:N-terminal nucleophile aminohydrolase [Neurospora crassa]|uniref:L-asparaginase n=1 Tax=Neurospora crassa (strain ATCC 24698 / 74-OR23-1A / CBS 708.71 / DSM 1257 / FGSC 987) TaxID=367110 RepID=Q7S5Y2_NEUCR|nr:L-asparaginase [Neurospora crassa OR74A]EAA30932.1 L-asparaginase [Neurospora crassa OR74A]KHE80574.1 N-terminal nucleophile aminohydrolase [Neurospora crassa]|eukprot:XP_960168.1 L-asparaginase [Neurospora crassa OR74A]
MEYKPQPSSPTRVQVQPRLIIHGGAGNITPASLGPERYVAYRSSLLTIVSKAHTYLTTPTQSNYNSPSSSSKLPSALEAATYAVTLLEDNPLFNSGHGAVFTRDGINELEASVMVSRGQAKRGVGVTGLRHVRNPILLAKKVLEHGKDDLLGRGKKLDNNTGDGEPDVPSAQGHTLIHGPTAEKLARQYGLEMVDPSYFFTQKRWDEHVRALEREKREQQDLLGAGTASGVSATWSKDEYLPQGTVGAVALDVEGVICVATSTGGMTNKLTGRIGDTPVVGAGFWAEEWTEEGDPTSPHKNGSRNPLYSPGPAVVLSDALKRLIADCLPSPFLYTPTLQDSSGGLTTTRSIGVSGTGNGDSFFRVSAARTVGAIARYSSLPSVVALTKVAGPSGELQKSADDRWGKAGEGEGGIIGLELVVVRDASGNVVETRSDILQDYNCGGMFRAWIDEEGVAYARIFRKDQDISSSYVGEGRPEDPRFWSGEKI